MSTLWPVVLLAVVAVFYAVRFRKIKADERRLTTLVDERTSELLEMTEQLQVANAALEELATVDSVTGLANRRRFDVFLQQEWQRSGRTRLPLSLMLVDIDHFKKFNDGYGHPAGDECIRQVAGVLREAANRGTDLCCRYGGEEFAVVLVDTGAAGALAVAEGIRSEVERLRIPHRGAPAGIVTVSVGVATRVGGNYASVIELISGCDRALYRVKELGRNRTEADTAAVA
jgi:diguanylate cyclase (GGDEF)-like protein